MIRDVSSSVLLLLTQFFSRKPMEKLNEGLKGIFKMNMDGGEDLDDIRQSFGLVETHFIFLCTF